MLATATAFNDQALARVKDPRQRAALARLIEDSDRALTDQIMKEARARDRARAGQQKAKPSGRKRAKARV